MATINAWQHIFSNVEQEHSPQGRGGFQTLFYSHHGLTEAEVEEMESYLLYFPAEVEPVKRLFFTTSTGKGVVAQIVFLPQPDQFGRGGRYLAHSLIFAPDVLAQFDADPFRVFRQFSFVTTIDDALAQGNFKTGDIPPVSLLLPANPTNELNAARGWPVSDLKKLSLLALRAQQQAQQKDALTVTGPPEQIEQALEAAFLAVPVARRRHCSFDTYFYRCNLVATYFWAIGLPEPPVSIKFAQVDGVARKVLGRISVQAETAYERWIMPALDAANLADITRHRDSAFALAQWLEGQPYDLELLTASPNQLITAMFEANPAAVQTMLRNQIRQTLPASLVDRAAEKLYRQTSGLDLYRQLRQGFELSHLADVLYQSYAGQNFEPPSREEVKNLEALLLHVDQPMLQLFIAYWTSPRKELPTALQQTTDGAYRQFAEISKRLNLLNPLALLVPGRGDSFLDLYLNDMNSNVVELSEALIDAGEEGCLIRLTPYLSELSDKDVKKLAKLVEEYRNIPEPFQKAIADAIAARPQATGVKVVIKKILGRST